MNWVLENLSSRFDKTGTSYWGKANWKGIQLFIKSGGWFYLKKLKNSLCYLKRTTPLH